MATYPMVLNLGVFRKAADLPEIEVQICKGQGQWRLHFCRMPVTNDSCENGLYPVQQGLAHRIGGLEKEADTGNVSYDPANHEYMTKVREEPSSSASPSHIPGTSNDKCRVQNRVTLLILWAGDRLIGVATSVVRQLRSEGSFCLSCPL